MKDLWPHQIEAMDNLRKSIGQGVRRIVVAAPTGAGKTRLAAEIVEGAQRKGKKLAFVVSSISLIDQTVEAFYSEGIRGIGVIQAAHQLTDWSKPIQVCSTQTLARQDSYPAADIVVIDECHLLFEFHKKWLTDQAWQNIPFIGLSATPYTRGLGKYFESLLIVATTQELIEKGLLSKFRVFATGHPNLSQVKIVAGDYHEGQLSKAMQEGTLTADIIDTWKKRHGKDKTFVYGVDCQHAQALQARFQAAGITCAYQDANTPLVERAAIKKGFHDGSIQVIANVGTLTVGVDYDVRCIVLARPTRSEMLFVQIIGRGLRIAEGKQELIVLDHSDTTARLGFVSDIHHDHLDDGKLKKKTAAVEAKKKLPTPCPQCDCLLPRINKVCTNCGHVMPVVSGVMERDGELAEITAGQKFRHSSGRKYTTEEKREFYAMLMGYGIEKKFKPGWSAQNYKKKFGVWPRGMDDTVPKEPDMVVRSWIKSQLIRWFKGKEAQKRKHEARVAV